MKISVRVNPRSSRKHLEQISDTEFRVHVNTPPVDGAANKEVCKLLAKHFGVAKSSVTIVRGQNSRDKVVEIAQ